MAVAALLTNTIAGILILLHGTKEERTVVIVGVSYVLLPPLIFSYTVGAFRYGIFGLEIALLIALGYAALKNDRWWLIVASGAQLLTCLTHIVSFHDDLIYTWSAVTVRMGLWIVVSLFLLLGAWETWAHRALNSKGVAICRESGVLSQP